MKKHVLFFLVLSIIFIASPVMIQTGFAQQQDRISVIEQQLKDISSQTKGLNDKIDFSVTGVSIQEFLRGIAESHSLNISVDPMLNIKVYNNFTSEKVINVILFLVKQYDLDVQFMGSIMSFSKYAPPVAPNIYVPKEIIVKYNAYNNLLSLDLKNDTLEKVVKKITQETKKNVVFAPGLGNRLLNVYIQDMPFDNALEKLVFANNLKVQKTEDNFYLLQALEEGELSQVIAGNKYKNNSYQRLNKNNNNAPVYIDITKDSSGKKFITFEAINVPIATAIKSVSEAVGVNYFLFSEVGGNITTTVNNVNFEEFLSYLLLGTEYTYKKELGLFLIGDRKLEGLRANRVFQFQYRSFSDVQEIIPTEIRKGVEIKEFKELNSILLTGSLPQILEIEAFLKKLDRVVPMVMIEVIMLDVRKGRSVSTGLSAGLSDTIKSGGTIAPGVDFVFSSKSINNFLSYLGANSPINIGRVTPNFYIGLKALESNNNVDVRQMPKLSTLNGHDATLSIGSTRYYKITKSNVIGTGLTPTVSNAIEWIPVQANLAIGIKPIVAGDDQVTLNIDVHISDFLDGPDINVPPSAANSQFKSMIRVKNEEMIVLGGIERMEKSEKSSGLPILSRIPILKWIFSNRTKSKNKIVSIVFIKPTIIY